MTKKKSVTRIFHQASEGGHKIGGKPRLYVPRQASSWAAVTAAAIWKTGHQWRECWRRLKAVSRWAMLDAASAIQRWAGGRRGSPRRPWRETASAGSVPGTTQPAAMNSCRCTSGAALLMRIPMVRGPSSGDGCKLARAHSITPMLKLRWGEDGDDGGKFLVGSV